MISTSHCARARLLCTALLILLCSALTAALPGRAAAALASLSWTAPASYVDGAPLTRLTGYKIHLGTSPGRYSQQIDVGNVTSYTISGLDTGTSYYFAVSAYDEAGNASGLSNEASKTFPASYTLTAGAGPGGNINPPSTTLQAGDHLTFYVTPSSGYQIADVMVDNVTVGAVGEYTFSNISNNHTISATFTPTPLVKLIGNRQGTFPLIQDSYDAVPDGAAATALVRAHDFIENLELDRNVMFTLNGGFDASFADNPDTSVLDGALTIGRGTLVADNLVIR